MLVSRVTMTVAVCLVSACVGGGGGSIGLLPHGSSGSGGNSGPELTPPTDTQPPVTPPAVPEFNPPPVTQPPVTPPAAEETGASVGLRSPRPVDYRVAHASNEPIWDVVVSADDDGDPVWDVVVNRDGDGILMGTKEAADIIGRGNGELDEGITAQEMIGLFEDEYGERGSHLSRWGKKPPVVRMGAKATDEDRRDIMLAVRMINSALPPNWQIKVRSTGAEINRYWTGSQWNWLPHGISAYHINKTPEGHIDILFEKPRSGSIGSAYSAYDKGTWDKVLSTRIYVDPERTRTPDGEYRISVLLEEILHALGRLDHGKSMRRYDSILKHWRAEGFLGTYDEAALAAVYGTPLPFGKTPHTEQSFLRRFWYISGNLEELLDHKDLEYEDLLHVDDLDPWTAVPYHASDEIAYSGTDPLRFGAIWRYGLSRPYMMGMGATGAIADTSGSASWSGKLVGLTPEAETVRGDMGMRVSFGDAVTGSLEFTNLMKGVAKEGLAAEAEGTPWMGGDDTLTDSSLSYGITVDTASGLFFQSGSGINDGGRITGAFFGSGLGGVGGTLRRSDLAGGFGGVKQSP